MTYHSEKNTTKCVECLFQTSFYELFACSGNFFKSYINNKLLIIFDKTVALFIAKIKLQMALGNAMHVKRLPADDSQKPNLKKGSGNWKIQKFTISPKRQ